MTTTSTTTPSTTTPSKTTNSSIKTTTSTETEHYSISRNEDQNRDRPETRTKDSHLGITIRRGGPASGRPEPTLRAVDLHEAAHEIVSMGGWASWS